MSILELSFRRNTPVKVTLFVYHRDLANFIKQLVDAGIIRNLSRHNPLWGFLRSFSIVDNVPHIAYIAYGCSKIYGVMADAEVCDDFIKEIHAKGYYILCGLAEDSKYEFHPVLVIYKGIGKCAGELGILEFLEKSKKQRIEGGIPVKYLNCNQTWEELVDIAGILGGNEWVKALGKKDAFTRFAGCKGTASIPPEERRREGTESTSRE